MGYTIYKGVQNIKLTMINLDSSFFSIYIYPEIQEEN